MEKIILGSALKLRCHTDSSNTQLYPKNNFKMKIRSIAKHVSSVLNCSICSNVTVEFAESVKSLWVCLCLGDFCVACRATLSSIFSSAADLTAPLSPSVPVGLRIWTFALRTQYTHSQAHRHTLYFETTIEVWEGSGMCQTHYVAC